MSPNNKPNSRILLFSTIIIFIGLCSYLPAQGFYFGRNKIQYTNFRWQVLKTDHFNVYYYPEMEDMARKGAAMAEESFKLLQIKFNSFINRRIPLIFYSSHLHFEQTNVSPGFIPEGVGGFFEFLKGRVVIPNNGNLAQFKHVIRHELVHVFMHNKLYKVYTQHGIGHGAFPPLWFTEGLADYWSSDWDALGEMILKDAVINNYVAGLEDMARIRGTFTMYKTGQNVLGYISRTYGEDKILQLLENMWRVNDFRESFKLTLGVDYKQFDRGYLHYLKKHYYPDLKTDNFVADESETLVSDGFNFKPAFYKTTDGDKIVFVGNRSGYASIFIKAMDKPGAKVETLIEGGATSDFESFHLFDSKIDVNQNGILAFSSKSGETDALYLYDIAQRRVIAKHYFKGLVGLFSPSWSPDGTKIVFSSLQVTGYKDIFIFDLAKGLLKQLTHDIYNDTDPSWAPDKRHIAFSSDRGAYGFENKPDIFLMDSSGADIRHLTYGPSADKSPVFSPDGKYLAFTSDKGGVFNIFSIKNPLLPVVHHDLSVKRLQKTVGTLFDPEWTDKGGLLFGSFEGQQFTLHRVKNVETLLEEKPEEPTPIMALKPDYWNPPNIHKASVLSNKPYIKKYDLDIVQTQVAQDPIFGTSGGAQIAFTDLMGNDQYNILLYNNARASSEFLKSFNFSITHIALGKKINYAYGIFRFAGEFYNPQDFYYFEDRSGALINIAYPLSQFTRLEFNQSISYSDKTWIFDQRRFAWLSTSYVSFVHDNSIWTPTGPIDGNRFNITIGNTYDFMFSNVNYFTALVDLRYYYRLSLRSAYAVRAMGLINQGKETRQFYLGGSWDLRGYPMLSLRGRQIALLSQEIRFPLIDAIGMRLAPGFSIGFNSIRGALFFDVGNAWNDTYRGMLGSFGVGARVPLGYFTLRWDFGKTTDFKTISRGIFTQFFFGWDF